MILLFGFGCIYETKIIETPPTKQESDNSTPTVRKQILEPWDEKKKYYWISVYFARFSHDPNMRQKFLPPIVYGICECIIVELEKKYSLKEFEQKLHGSPTGQVSPEIQQFMWNVSYGCSQIGAQIQMQQMMEQNQDGPSIPLKDAI